MLAAFLLYLRRFFEPMQELSQFYNSLQSAGAAIELILDEATSSLDMPSERQVQRALRTIPAERTAVIIAHRLSTVEIADRVLVLGQGRVVEDGPPEQLLRDSGRYADLRQAWLDSLV